jgi:hypothetical protein
VVEPHQPTGPQLDGGRTALAEPVVDVLGLGQDGPDPLRRSSDQDLSFDPVVRLECLLESLRKRSLAR